VKIKANRTDLLNAFSVAASVAPSRSPKPVLNNVKMEATADGLVLQATDMEIGIRIEVKGVEILAEGEALIPVARFAAILRESKDETLLISTDARGCTVKGDRSKFTLSTANPDEFPTVARFVRGNHSTIKPAILRDAIRKVLFAADSESTRYALAGVKIELAEGEASFIATDGRRLAVIECESTLEGNAPTANAIVPSQAMSVIDKALNGRSADALIHTDGNAIHVECDGVTIIARLVEGRFPKWRDVLPQYHSSIKLSVTVGDLHAAMRQGSIATSEESRGVSLEFAANNLSIAASAAEIGESEIQMPINYSGEPVTVALDFRYVIDFLKVLDQASTCEVELQNSESAVTLSQGEYVCVVMPLAGGR
jgi:DNA polymerase-3 subunit beta